MVIRFLLAAMLVPLGVAMPAIAADQGEIAQMSTGQITISVSVASRATLSETANMSSDSHQACLWLGTATRGYAVTAVDGRIAWHPSVISPATTALSGGTTSAPMTAPATRPDCARDPASLVGYSAADATAAAPATLLIVPE